MDLFKISQSDRHQFCEHIIETSAPKADFYFLVILSTLIVALGLIKDNVILVIGGMLVTPLLSPILAISLGIIIRNLKVFTRSLRIFFASFALAVIVAYIVGIIVNFNIDSIGLMDFMQPSWYIFIVAVVAGLAASFTWAKPNLNNALPGIAITVTLIPPLVAMGLSIASVDLEILRNVFYTLCLNVLGIILASIVVFSLMEFYKAKRKLISEVKEEAKEMQK